MNWSLNDKEITTVLSLNGPARYSYFIKRISDWETIWSLFGTTGWALAADGAGRELVPVWPHEKYAERCASGNWEGFAPKAIPLDAWLEKWIPGMTADKRLVAVFPTPNDKGLAVEPSRMEGDLQRELSNYE